MLMIKKQRGDTLIEVLIAVTVFSAVAVGAISVMTRGIAAAQTSLEMNLVRNQIDTQAELLHHLHAVEMNAKEGSPEATGGWDTAISLAQDAASDYDTIKDFNSHCKPATTTSPIGMPSHAFYIDPGMGGIVKASSAQHKFVQPTTFSQVYSGPSGRSEMVWIEAVKESDSSSDSAVLKKTRYYDFHIRACWDSPGADGGLMKLGTIVRLYAPK